RKECEPLAAYRAEAGVRRAPEGLYADAEAWRGMSRGLLKGFRKWMLDQGYAISSVNMRLATVRQYATLAHDAGVIAEEDYDLLMTVKGYSAKSGRNIDVERRSQGRPTRKSTKKAAPTPVSTGQALRLKTETTHPR